MFLLDTGPCSNHSPATGILWEYYGNTTGILATGIVAKAIVVRMAVDVAPVPV